MMSEPITSFDGEYRFLSNFFPAPFTFFLDGERSEYKTSEHAFQALKTLIPEKRDWVRAASTPEEAKKRGHQVPLRSDWETLKIPLMKALLVQKFRQNPELEGKLLATGDAELVEGNWWGDVFWGICKGKGKNHLGKLLCEVRKLFQELKEEKEAQLCHSE